MYFNSTMVRLKAGSIAIPTYRTPLFQFHYGTIKRKSLLLNSVSTIQFQFHYGTIKRIIFTLDIRLGKQF